MMAFLDESQTHSGVLAAVDIAKKNFEKMRDDPSDGIEGWLSHETLVCAALCLDLFPEDPWSAVRRSVTTDGDSDTIAAVTGALAGSVHPFPWKGVPED